MLYFLYLNYGENYWFLLKWFYIVFKRLNNFFFYYLDFKYIFKFLKFILISDCITIFLFKFDCLKCVCIFIKYKSKYYIYIYFVVFCWYLVFF